MLIYKTGSDSLIVVLHEVYGINQHITKVCKEYYSKGYDVYCPDLLNLEKPFCYAQQDEAYSYFNDNIGFRAKDKVFKLLEEVRPYYKKIILVGFSIGATIAWLCTESNLCDGVVCFYGSRIRDYLGIVPRCSSLLIFASKEKSFSPVDIVNVLESTANVQALILEGDHGFCDPFSRNFNEFSAMTAGGLAWQFISSHIPMT